MNLPAACIKGGLGMPSVDAPWLCSMPEVSSPSADSSKMLKYQFQSVNTGQTWSNYVLWCPYQLLEPLNQSRRSHWWCLVSQRWVQKSDFQSTLRSVPERFLVEFSGQITCKSSPWVSPTCWRCRRLVSSGAWVTFPWIYFLGQFGSKFHPWSA